MTVLSRLARSRSARERPRILSTTVNASSQRVPPLAKVAGRFLLRRAGQCRRYGRASRNGSRPMASRAPRRVRDTGEYAVRGGILDLFAPGDAEPIRLDFFGDTLESIRSFRSRDPAHRRASCAARSRADERSAVDLRGHPPLPPGLCRGIRRRTRGDTLYEAVSEGRRHPGLEHWLPLFYDGLDTLFDYTGGAPLVLDPLTPRKPPANASRRSAIITRRAKAHTMPIPPIRSISRCRPMRSICRRTNGARRWRRKASRASRPFRRRRAAGRLLSIAPASSAAISRPNAPTRAPMSSAPRRSMSSALQAQGKRVIVAGWSEGSRERLGHVLKDFGLNALEPVSSLQRGFAAAEIRRGACRHRARDRLRGAGSRGDRRAGHSRRPARSTAARRPAARRISSPRSAR